jgi:hypothetical protein
VGAVFFLKTPPRLTLHISLLRVKTPIPSDWAAAELSGAASFLKAPPWSPMYVTLLLVVCWRCYFLKAVSALVSLDMGVVLVGAPARA